jgi:hypothetical protein
MSALPRFDRADFDRLVADHREAIRLVNELEFQLYRLSELADGDRVAPFQRAGGQLIGLLRNLLFRHDQQPCAAMKAGDAPNPLPRSG